MQAPCSFLQAKAYTTKTLRALIYTVDKAEKKKTIGGYRPGRRFKKKKTCECAQGYSSRLKQI